MRPSSPRVRKGHRVLAPRSAEAHLHYARLQAVADKHRPAFKRAYLAGVRALRAKLPLDLLAQAASDPHAESRIMALVTSTPVLKDAGLAAAAMSQITEMYQNLLYQGAKEADTTDAAELEDLAMPVFTLTMESPLVVAYAQKMAATMVTEVTTETQAAIRQIIADAAQNGVHPYDQAKQILQLIGLHSSQARAVQRYATELDPGLKTEVADRMINRYADRLLDNRAETIARTETIRAANMGVRMGGDALLDTPGFTPDDLKYVWIVTPDDALCDECESMETGEPTDDTPPLHPNCRCCLARLVPDVEELSARLDAQEEARSALGDDGSPVEEAPTEEPEPTVAEDVSYDEEPAEE